ncbi:MAG: ABC transporter ATP-binding protein [Promethearchaeota archaeon]
MSPKVELMHVTKKYDNLVALNDLNLTINNGEYLILLGPTGSGKSTTLKLIAGLIQPDKGGEIYIDNLSVNNIPTENRNIGFVFARYALFPHLDVINNLIYSPRVKGESLDESRKSAREMLELMVLTGRGGALPKELSGGMKQRVALARTLMSGAQLLLLDEPLGALDARIRMALRKELRKIVKDLNVTAIHATNDIIEAFLIADRIAILREGTLIQIGTPAEVYENPKSIFVANFLSDTNFFAGKIKKVEKNSTIIELDNGLRAETNKISKAENSRIVLGIRAEDIQIYPKRKINKPNYFHGKVESSKFISGTNRYEVYLENKERVIVREKATLEWFEEDEQVTIYFHPRETLIFDYPEEGLEKALELE